MTVGGKSWEPDALELYHMLLDVRMTWAFRLMPKAIRIRVLKKIGEIPQ